MSARPRANVEGLASPYYFEGKRREEKKAKAHNAPRGLSDVSFFALALALAITITIASPVTAPCAE